MIPLIREIAEATGLRASIDSLIDKTAEKHFGPKSPADITSEMIRKGYNKPPEENPVERTTKHLMSLKENEDLATPQNVARMVNVMNDLSVGIVQMQEIQWLVSFCQALVQRNKAYKAKMIAVSAEFLKIGIRKSKEKTSLRG